MPALPVIFFAFCGIIGLIFWFTMIDIMEKNGLKVSYSCVHPGQYFQFYKLMKKEKNLSKKIRYKLIFWIQILLIPFYFFGMILTIVLSND
jgi:predicted membrane protein